MNIGDKFHGFTLTNKRENRDINGTFYEFVFDKTGTKLCWIDNGLENKLFSITFKTIPFDSSGVFHILEHSVLCGSKKFPVKEPFVELLKSSMNTFLNAMTFPDKTMYPVSSKNDKDFLNLTEVYLDSVFYPSILTNKNIFMQEGWRLAKEENEYFINGVVYNEMKGATDGPENVEEEKLSAVVFADTPYRYNSGGDPADIPSLTYEKFVESYNKFYHPSNAYIFLDGNIPLEKTFALIESYLDKFEKIDVDIEIPLQQKGAKEGTFYYDIGEESAENKTRLSFSNIICDYSDKEKVIAAMILEDAIAGTNDSVLSKAVIKSGLADDLLSQLNNYTIQPSLTFTLLNVRDGKDVEIKEILFNKIKELISDGIDRNALTASLNRIEFRMKEPEEPVGLNHAMNAFTSWLYGGDPLSYLVFDDVFDSLREKMNEGYFEKLLNDLFNDGTYCTVYVKPKEGYNAELAKVESDKIAQMVSEMTDEELKVHDEELDRFNEWQQTPDTEESLATIPMVNLEDISLRTDSVESEISDNILYHNIYTSGISHVNIYFNMSDFTLEEMPYVNIVSRLLGKFDTESYNSEVLQNEIKTYTGRLNFGLSAATNRYGREFVTPYLMASTSFVNNNEDKAYSFVKEILFTTKLDEKEKVREMLTQMYEEEKQDAMGSGHVLAMTYAKASFSSVDAFSEVTGGITFIQWLKAFLDNFDENADRLITVYEKIKNNALLRNNLVISHTGDKRINLSAWRNGFAEGASVKAQTSYSFATDKKVGFAIPSQVSYVAKTSMFDKDDIKSSAALKVLTNIASLDYLWQMIRVRGGAYGTGISARDNGTLFSYTYRDPNAQNSVEVFNTLSGMPEDLAESGIDIDKFIISGIAGRDNLLTPRDRGVKADMNYLRNMTEEDEMNIRKALLETKIDDFRLCSDILKDFEDNANICVVGPKSALNELEGFTVKNLF